MFVHTKGRSRIRGLGREIARKFLQNGLWEKLKGGTSRLVHETRKLLRRQDQNCHPFDVKYGTDTGGIIQVGALDSRREGGPCDPLPNSNRRSVCRYSEEATDPPQ